MDVEQHKKIKELIDEKGRVGICSSSLDISEELGMSKEEVQSHLEIMAIDQYIVKPNEVDLYCNNEALVFMLKLLGYDIYLT